MAADNPTPTDTPQARLIARVRRERAVWANEHRKPNAVECDDGPHGKCDLCRLLADIEAALDQTAPPSPWEALEAEIEKSLIWMQRASFTVDYKLIGRGAGGLAAVVEASDAMHALLFVRAVLRRALPAPPAEAPQEHAGKTQILAALEELTAACERDLCSVDTNDFTDEESVGGGLDGDCSVTFGMIRRARALLSGADR